MKLGFAVLCVLLVLAVVSAAKTKSKSKQCGCGWASPQACANPDGSHCHKVCCGSKSPVPAPHVNNGGWQGSAKTTRYWDCCKASCSWPSNVPGGRSSVRSCQKDGKSPAGANGRNICGGGGDGGPNYVCNDQQPFTQNGVLYAFAASNVDCCSCYELQFTNTALAGKRMIVQVTNKGGDLSQNHFDLMIPGGGLGIFDGCTPMFGQFNGGARYGGISSKGQCSQLPGALQSGCHWRFGDFMNADNPNVNFKKISCPSELTNRSGCKL